MSGSRRAREWPLLIGEARDLLVELARDGAEVLDGAHVPRWDGYPSVAAGAGDGRGGSADLGDRVADRVDQVEQGLAHEMRQHLLAALKALRRANDARLAAIRPPPPPKAPARPTTPGCVNCDRYEIYEVAVEAGRCADCLDHWRRFDRDAPEHVVRARDRNQRRRPRLPAADPQVLAALRDSAGITERGDLSITVDDMALRPDRVQVMPDPAQGGDQDV
ncbi:MAG: hypothetical protein ACOCT8_03160 [Actinomycetota bacterium]